MVVSVINIAAEIRVLNFDLPTNECDVGDEPLGGGPPERTIGASQSLILVRPSVLANEYSQRNKCGIAKRKPGEVITGLNLSDFYFVGFSRAAA